MLKWVFIYLCICLRLSTKVLTFLTSSLDVETNVFIQERI